MAEDVENTLENILKQFGEMSDQDAINYIETMKVWIHLSKRKKKKKRNSSLVQLPF